MLFMGTNTTHENDDQLDKITLAAGSQSVLDGDEIPRIDVFWQYSYGMES